MGILEVVRKIAAFVGVFITGYAVAKNENYLVESVKDLKAPAKCIGELQDEIKEKDFPGFDEERSAVKQTCERVLSLVKDKTTTHLQDDGTCSLDDTPDDMIDDIEKNIEEDADKEPAAESEPAEGTPADESTVSPVAEALREKFTAE